MRFISSQEIQGGALEGVHIVRPDTDVRFRFDAPERVTLTQFDYTDRAEPGLLARLGTTLGEFTRAYSEAWSYAFGSPPPPAKSVLYRRAVKRVAARKRAAS